MFDDKEEPCFEDEAIFAVVNNDQKEDAATAMDTETAAILVEDRIATGG